MSMVMNSISCKNRTRVEGPRVWTLFLAISNNWAMKYDPDKYLENFAQVLRAHRASAGLTQDQLAARAGLHRTYLSALELGARNISLHTLCLLSEALDVRASQL